MEGFLADAWSAADALDWQAALALVAQAIRIAPQKPELRCVRGRFLVEYGRLAAAEGVFKEVLRISADCYLAWTDLGILYLHDGRHQKAAFCFEQSLSFNPDHNVYTLLANSQLVFDLEASRRSAESALAMEPGWEEAERILSKANAGLGET